MHEEESCLKREERELAALRGLVRAAARLQEQETLLRAALREAMRLGEYEAGGLYQIDPLAARATLRAHEGISQRLAEAAATFRVPEEVRTSREPYLLEKATAMPVEIARQLDAEGFHSVALVPLYTEEEIVGLIGLAAREKRVLNTREKALLATVGEVVGIGLARLSHHQKLMLFRRAADEALEALGIADDQGTIRYANQALAELHGADSPDRLIGRTVLSFLGDQNPEHIRDGIKEHLHLYGRWQGEVEVRGLDGVVRTVLASAVAHRDRAGKPEWISTRFQDLTATRQRETLWRALERTGAGLLRLRDARQIQERAIEPLEEAGVRAMLLLLDAEGKSLRLATHNVPEVERAAELAYPWEPEANPTVRLAMEGGEALFVQNPAARVRRGAAVSPFAEEMENVQAIRPDDRGVLAPLYMESQPQGVLVVLDPSITEQDCGPLGLYALQVAASLDNARLFQEERERRHLAETLRQVSAALTSTLDRQAVLDLILEQLQRMVPYHSASFMVPEGQHLRVVAGRGYPDWEQLRRLRISHEDNPDFRALVYEGKIACVPDSNVHPTWVNYPSVEYVRAWMGAPVMIGGEVKGVLNIDFAQPFQPSEKVLEALRIFAAQAAVAIRNAELHEQTLRLQRFNERLVQEMQEGLALEDARGFLTYVNPALARMLGYRAEEMVGRRWSRFVAPEDLPEAERRSLGRREGRRDRYILRLLRADGSQVPCQMSARPIFEDEQFVGTLSVASDISDRLAREGQLRAAKEYLENLLDNIPVGVLRLNRRGEIVYMNPALEEMVGATLEERQGMNALEFPTIQAVGIDNVYRRGLEGEPFGAVERFYRSMAGVERYLRVQGVPLLDDQGEVVELLVLHEDMTAQRALEARLQESQKMDALSHLSRQVVHDFNNTLAMVLGYVSSLQVDLPPGHPLQEDLKTIARVIERGKELPAQLLTFASGGRFRVEAVDCRALAQEVVKMMQRSTTDVEWRMVLPPDPWPARGDPGDVQLILMNLCLNAIEAMPAGGRLVVGLSNETLTEEDVYLHPGCQPGRYVRLWVEDSGEGMDREAQRRIFEPFFSTRGQGRGLGMAIVYNVVQRHRGFIEVQSEPENGSVIEVYLPATVETPPSDAAAVREEPPAYSPVSGREVILVVEDEPIMRRLLERRLLSAGYQVLGAGDGSAAWRVFREHQEEIALVVLDLVMPGLNGADLCAYIGEVRPGMPVLLSTGRADLTSEAAEFRQVRAEILHKPYDIPTFLRRVHAMLEAGQPG